MFRPRYFEGDLDGLIARQLGRKPSIVFRIEMECEYGWPALLGNSPFDASGNPNPNLYYLSCPYLRKRISTLEDSGMIARLQQMITDDPILKADLDRAQGLHDLEWRRAAKGRNGKSPVGQINIAGSRDANHLKCMHAHFAYFLAHRDYMVGAMIAKMIHGDFSAVTISDISDKIWCNDEICRKWKRITADGV